MLREIFVGCWLNVPFGGFSLYTRPRISAPKMTLTRVSVSFVTEDCTTILRVISDKSLSFCLFENNDR